MIMLTAATATQGPLMNLIVKFGNIVDALIPIVSSLAVLAFLWGVAKYIMASGNEDEKSEGKGIMIKGIIALFVIFALGGIIQLMENIIGVGGNNQLHPPTVPEMYVDEE